MFETSVSDKVHVLLYQFVDVVFHDLFSKSSVVVIVNVEVFECESV